MTTPPPRRRSLRLLPWLAGGLVLGGMIAAMFLLFISRSEWGHERILAFTLRALGKNVHGGELRVERMDGDLLTGAHLYGVSLRSRDGEPFLTADSAYADYDVRTLPSRRIVIERLVLYNPNVLIRRLPGDTLWNYQEIFADTSSSEREERLTLVGSLRIVNGKARVQLPWEPTEGLTARQQRREVAEVLSDTSQLLVHRVRGGLLRTVHFSDVHGQLSRIRFAPGSEAGTYLRVDTLAATAQIFRQPARVHSLQGEVALRKDHVQFRFPRGDLPNSRVAASGVVRFPPQRDADPQYDVAIRSDSLAFRDLRWIYPRFPADATGSLSLLVESRPEGMMFLGRDAVLRAPGTRASGSFGMILGDTIRFVDVDVKASPLRVSTIEQMLPEGLPVRGLTIGGVEIRGRGKVDPAAPDSAVESEDQGGQSSDAES